MKHPLQKSRIPESRAFLVKELKAPYFDKDWHFHPEYQLFWVMKGKGTRFIGDQMKPFKEGDLVLTGPNLPHLWRNDQEYFDKSSGLETQGIVVYFPDDFLGDTLWAKEEFEDVRNLLLRSARGLEIHGKTNRRIQVMMKELIRERGAKGMAKFLEILDTIAHSEECEAITAAGYINTNKESEKDRMSQVYEFVMENFRQKILLAEVAAIANMTESAFSRYFTSRMNKSFSEFLADVRIGHACKLLHEAEANISQVSYESGFQTLSNFNRQFKERMGVTPMVYRRDYLKTFS